MNQKSSPLNQPNSVSLALTPDTDHPAFHSRTRLLRYRLRYKATFVGAILFLLRIIVYAIDCVK